jgi:predicted alpha/beta-fold hydrolase
VSREIPFDPCPFLHDPHQQTVISAFLNWVFAPSSERKLISLPDGDKISLEITTPSSWKETDPTVVLVHGLCGSHKSPNPVRMTKRLEPLGIRAVRFNMRGCGSGKGFAKQIYHSGRSEDVFEAIKVLKEEHPKSPMILIGFSLGGNVVLKMAGELNTLAGNFLKRVIAVSPPVDLFSSVLMLGHEQNAMYEKYFYRLLRDGVHYLHRKFKDLAPVRLPKNLKLYEFDQIYTAPRCGFSNAHDYYNKCSAAHVVGDISIPCKILLAEDDPIVSSSSLDCYHLPSNVDVFKTKKGGHMGYLGNPTHEKGFHWLDSLLVDWILEN